MNAPHTRAICNECAASVIVQADGAEFRCNCCEAIIINSVTPGSQLGVSAATTKAPAPEPMVVAATFSESRAKEPEANARSAVATSGRLAMGSSRRDVPRSASATSEVMDVTARRDEQPNSVSDGAVSGSLPSGEIEPSVMLASAPFEFSSGDGLGNLEPGSITSGDRFAVTAGSGRARNRAAYPAVTGSFSNTPEASGTARKASSGSLLGEPSRISDRASLFLSVDPELEAAIAGLEADWFAQGISLADLTFPMLKNSMTFRVTQDSLIQASSSDISST